MRLGWAFEQLLRPHMKRQQSGPRVSALVALFLCIVSFALAAPAQELRQLPEALTNPHWLSNRTWKLDQGLESLMRDWPDYAGKQGFEEKTVLKSAKLTILDTVFKAEYRQFKKDQVAEIVIVGSEFAKSFCSAFLDWSAERLGKPQKLFDLSRGQEDPYVEIRAEWLFGETRAQFICGGITVSGKFIPIAATIVYRQKDSLKVPIDLVYLECSSSSKPVGLDPARPAEQEAPITLIIDPLKKALLNRNKVYFGKTIKYSEEEITASLDSDKSTGVFRLDRITGNYLWTTRAKVDSRLGTDFWGKCSPISPEKKF